MCIPGSIKTSILIIAFMAPVQAGHLIGGFGLYTGKSYFDLDNLNNDLARYGYAEASEDPITLGFDSHIIFGNRILLGIEYGHYSASAVSAGGGNSITGMKFIIYSGHPLYESKKWRLRPEIGIGFNDFDITLTKAQTSIEFDEVLTDPFRSTRIGLTEALFVIKLVIHRKLIKINSGNSLFLGFIGDYGFPIARTNWDGDFVSLKNGPRIDMGGLGLKFIVGISGILTE